MLESGRKASRKPTTTIRLIVANAFDGLVLLYPFQLITSVLLLALAIQATRVFAKPVCEVLALHYPSHNIRLHAVRTVMRSPHLRVAGVYLAARTKEDNFDAHSVEGCGWSGGYEDDLGERGDVLLGQADRSRGSVKDHRLACPLFPRRRMKINCAWLDRKWCDGMEDEQVPPFPLHN